MPQPRRLTRRAAHPQRLVFNVLTRIHPTRRLHQSLAVVATAVLMASVGCVAPPNGGFGHAFAHVLGFDCGCGCGDGCQCGNACSCGDCVNQGCTGCPPGSSDINGSGGQCCESGNCESNQCGGDLHVCNAVKRVTELPCDTMHCATSCCTPNACPGPPDVPPPGRFHPVPTRPAFSPRFEPTSYGPAEL
jgi:hypothetical protein